jgi:hypothetical protein
MKEYDRLDAAFYDYYSPGVEYSPDTQSRVELIDSDMRNFSLGRRFKLVTIPYRAFLHLLTPKDQRQALLCIREHLADDGRLIFNVFDPNLELIAASLGPLGSALKKDSEFIHPDTGHRVVVWFAGHIDPERQILDAHFIFEELDEEGKVLAKTYSPLTLRYVYRYEMRYLLELCGYKVEALYGDFRRGPFRFAGFPPNGRPLLLLPFLLGDCSRVAVNEATLSRSLCTCETTGASSSPCRTDERTNPIQEAHGLKIDGDQEH